MSDIKHRVKTFIRLLLGVYTANDYIRMGRYLAGGGTAKFVKKKFDRIGVVYHLEIPNFKTIGRNLVLAHPSGITVNPQAIIGDDCVIFKNVTIGSIRSGKRKGVPQIGNHCVIGAGAFVCGGIHIGDNVLIAANSFVDFDVPDNAIVIGNPGTIHHKDNATRDYQSTFGL